MSAATCLINGVRYGFARIEINLFGRIITGFTAISYDKEKAYGNEYGAGEDPVHRSVGTNTYSGSSMTMYKYEVDAIESQLPAGTDLTDIAPFSIKVVFLPKGSDQLQVETLLNVQFTKRSFKSQQGDANLQMEVPFIYAGLKRGI